MLGRGPHCCTAKRTHIRPVVGDAILQVGLESPRVLSILPHAGLQKRLEEDLSPPCEEHTGTGAAPPCGELAGTRLPRERGARAPLGSTVIQDPAEL
jgi:hypothetical protein